jgi:flavin reductase (DIM6/NTAB) family NADH-FMN oxidoreductase RutF
VDEGWIIPPMQFKMLNAKAVASVSLEPGSVVASTPSSWPEGVPALTGATVQLNCAVDQATGAYAACSGL